MRAPEFRNYLASIQALIGTLLDTVSSLEKKITTFRGRVQDGINVVESQKRLGEYETELANTRTKIEDLKSFFVNIKKKWSKAKERVIGFVRWAPPLVSASLLIVIRATSALSSSTRRSSSL